MLKRLFRERSRSRAVRAIGVAGAAAEPGLDRYAEQAAHAFAAPVALISLLHDDLQTIAASRGTSLTCIPREQGFCNHALDRGSILEVCDALEDARFACLPSVIGEPNVRYYIGASLSVFGGLDVGVLCVLDMRERPAASADQRAYLLAIARQASALLERRLLAAGSLAA